jgi:hypothetical protein
MTSSFVHVAFDPYPYVAFSTFVEAIGVLLAVRQYRSEHPHTTRNVPMSSTYRSARIGDRAPMLPSRTAEQRG